jgi:hypothetical protein
VDPNEIMSEEVQGGRVRVILLLLAVAEGEPGEPLAMLPGR